MLAKYMQAAMRRAKYGLLADDGSFYGEIPVCKGGVRQRSDPGGLP